MCIRDSFLFGMIFPNADDQFRHPSQLYEAFLEGLLLFIILNILIFRYYKLKSPGFVSGAFLLLYGVFRYSVEFTREPDVQVGYIANFFTMGMLLSIPMIIAGLTILLLANKK